MVSYAPLVPELGAAQMALNLARALSDRGHEVVSWWPGHAPESLRWWNGWLWRRQRLEDYLQETPPFDLIDLPPLAISRRIADRARLVARSVQPDLLYYLEDGRAALKSFSFSSAVHLLHGARLNAAVLRALRRASLIFCLGTAEREWMHRRLPWVRTRLASYFNALRREEQAALSRIREARAAAAGPGLRFLWIGRWTPHKGTARLVRFVTERLASRPQDSFTIAGTGPVALNPFPAGLLAEGRVRLVPSFERGELPALLRSHDAGLFTSTVEGWGLSLNEMLESGMPVFATEAGGVRDLRSYFPRSLLPFPPPLEIDFAACRESDLAGYYREFTWERIAELYEKEILHRVFQKASGGSS